MATTIQIPAAKPADPPAPDPKGFTQDANGTVQVTDPNASTGTQDTPKDPPQRPDYIPEKFWTGNLEESAKKLAESYTELERTKGSAKPPVEKPSADSAGTDQNAVEQLYGEAVEEFADRNGSLSPEMYNKFQKAGISPRTVNDYIEGRQAANELRKGQLVQVAGDQATLDAAFQWAAQSLTAEEVAWYNQAFNGSNAKAAERAMKSLLADYQENGQEPTMLSGAPAGDGRSSGGAQPFASMDEQVKAQSDPRYLSDPAYRQQVDNRVLAAVRSGGYSRLRQR
jgi:hypothetical protein